MINKNEISIIIISITLIIPNLVYGYMDPGTWSYLLSFIIAFFAGFLFYIKTIWGKIKETFNKLINRKK